MTKIANKECPFTLVDNQSRFPIHLKTLYWYLQDYKCLLDWTPSFVTSRRIPIWNSNTKAIASNLTNWPFNVKQHLKQNLIFTGI